MKSASIGLAVILMVSLSDAPARGAEPPRLERIRVTPDGRRFVLAESGRAFLPWGFNYVGKFDHLAEDDWGTPEGWKRIEADFREMKRLGANVVRWHLQFETFVKAVDRVDADQLGRLKRLLVLSRETGLYLDLTGLNCFRKDRIPAWYDALAEADRWKCQVLFWDAVTRTCAGDSTVFCYNLMNEPVIGEPKPDEPPWVTGELGGFYFVQRICNKPAGRGTEDIAESWVKTLVAAIRRHDKVTLITVGDIAWTVIWPGGKPAFASPQVTRHLDFVSVHIYPATGRIDKDIAALEPYDVGKPLVVEETFPMTCSLADLDRFVDASSPRVDGWIAHYFGSTPGEHRAGARPAGPLTADFLDYWAAKGPKVQPR